MTLNEIRIKIDSLDKELVELLSQRMGCSLEVAKIKLAENLPIYQADREKAIFEKVNNQGGKYGDYIENIYRSIMTVSRDLQSDNNLKDHSFSEFINSIGNKIKFNNLICQGVPGSFSHIASQQMFGDLNPGFYDDFEDVFKAVEQGNGVIGILPVENSNAGSVNTVYDLILKYNLYIIKSASVDISQNLIGLKNSDIATIKSVYSHPHALKQCDSFLNSNNFKCCEAKNTALAVKYVADQNNNEYAAIGSELAAEIYDLKIIKKDVQNEVHNQTRFIAISKIPIIEKDSNTVSLCFTTPHEQGSLYNILGRFANCGLNLTKIESRPAGKNFESKFYLDFVGNTKDKRTLSMLSCLKNELPYFKFLGNYKEI